MRREAGTRLSYGRPPLCLGVLLCECFGVVLAWRIKVLRMGSPARRGYSAAAICGPTVAWTYRHKKRKGQSALELIAH